MKGAKTLIFLVTLAAVTLPSHAQNPKVEFFYETLNEPARRLFVEQYRQVIESLNDQIDLRLYPYGRTTNNDGNYVCSSNLQCEANKIHACLIKAEILTENPPNVDQPINQTLASQFVQCFFKNRFSMDDVEELGNTCVPGDASADWGEIRTCVLTDTTITAQFETASEPAKEELAKNGLAVRVDGAFVELTTTSLAGAICAKLTTDPKPDICAQATTPPTKVKVVVYYEAQSLDANKYLDKQVGNFYHVIEDFVDIDFVPYGNTVKTGETYNCTLGNVQCISNKYQALVVDKYITNAKGDLVSGQDRVVNLARCLARSTSGNELTALEVCSRDNLQADDYRDFMAKIKLDSEEVKTVFERMRTQTEALVGVGNPLPRVPTVTVNGQLNYNALDDLVQETCALQAWIGPKASICTKTDVIILYEPLNHKSRSFFLDQFNSIFHNMYTLLNLDLRPAGRAQMVPGNGLTCRDGPDQCIAMQLQACAIDYFWNDGNNYTDPIRQEVFDFIACTFKNRHMKNVMDATEICGNEHIEADAWFTIHGCYQEGLGVDLVADNIEYTQSLVSDMEHHEVPTVLVNGTVVTDLTTIRKQICDFYDNYHQPDFCQNDEPSKVDISIYYESTDELSKHFFTTQYDPWYIYIEEMANIKLYAAGNVREALGDNGTCDSNEANSACMANKLVSIINDQLYNHDDGDFIDGTLRTMLFHSCYFSHNNFKDNIYSAAEYCSELHLPNDEWFDLLVTAKSDEGATTYASIVEATKKLANDNGLTDGLLTHIPWVTLNNKNFSRMAQNDLMTTVCQKYGGERPLECTPVEVTIYYSANHAQSRRFFIDELETVYRHLRPRVHLQLVPYGVADASQTIENECSKRESVCTANKAHACALKKFFDDEVGENTLQWDGKNQTITFIRCMFRNNKNQEDVSKLIEDCANEDFILADEITECVHQAEGLEYLTEMRNKTLEQFESMEHAPWIVINGMRSAAAQTDLKTAVCDAMLGDKPDFCYEPTPSKVKVEFHYSTYDTKVQSYVVEELYPHYRNLEEIINLDVVPFGDIELIRSENGTITSVFCPNGGVEECHATLIHACVYEEFFHNDDDPVSDNFDEFDGKVQVIDFLNCYFSNPLDINNLVNAASQCVEQTFNDALSTIMNCARDPVLGPSILAKFQETKVDMLLPHLAYLPWVTVDGRHSYTVEHHFPQTVCDSYQGTEKPLDCYSRVEDPKPIVMIHYEVGVASSKDFFDNLASQPVTSVADVTFVPFGRSNYTGTDKKCVNNEDCTQYLEHACLINLFYENHANLTIQTIACTFEEKINDEDVVNECVNANLGGVEEIADPWNQINSCVREQGDALMTANEGLASSLTPKMSHSPWVVVNNEHDLETEDSLMNGVCGYWYSNDKPAACQPKQLDVAIYYETNNTDASSYFLNQLASFTEYLDEFAQFSFIPYGKTTNNGGQLSCPNSAEQCVANAFHACVINRFYNHSNMNPDTEFEKNRIRVSGFIECTFVQQELGNVNPEDNAERCFNEIFKIDSRDVLSCAVGPEGKELLAEMGRQTSALSPPLSSIPVVTIGGVQSQDAPNFFQRLCRTYGNVRPGQCSSLPSPSVKVGVYFTGNQASIDLLNSQLYPFYEDVVPVLRDETQTKLYDTISPELVAWGNTKYDESNTENPFTCEGEKECYINRFFACANHFHGHEPRSQRHLLSLALCFANKTNALTDPADAFNVCTNNIWFPDPFVTLETCATINNKENIDIALKSKAKTENTYPVLTTFPAITVNNNYNADASKYLLYIVCNNFGGDRPSACETAEEPPPSTGPTTPVPTATQPTATEPTATQPTVTEPTVTQPTVTQPTATQPTATQPTVTEPTATQPSSDPTTTEKPGGSGTTPVISIFILFVSFFISRFM